MSNAAAYSSAFSPPLTSPPCLRAGALIYIEQSPAEYGSSALPNIEHGQALPCSASCCELHSAVGLQGWRSQAEQGVLFDKGVGCCAVTLFCTASSNMSRSLPFSPFAKVMDGTAAPCLRQPAAEDVMFSPVNRSLGAYVSCGA